MRDIPVMLSGYKLTVVEAPTRKMREEGPDKWVPVTDRNGAVLFVVSLFAKLQVGRGERAPKGEEIKVTLATDPGEGFEEDTRVELIDAKLNAYQIDTEHGPISGVSFKAMGLKAASVPAPRGGEK